MKELHSVEMVGDCIRTPILQQIIKESFGFDVSKTLAPDEAVARGATLFVIIIYLFIFLLSLGCYEFPLLFFKRLQF